MNNGDTRWRVCSRFLGHEKILAMIVPPLEVRCKVPYSPRRKNTEIKFRVEPRVHEAFDKYCDRVKATKSDVLREYLDFLIEHPELEEYGTGKELLEKLLSVYKATSPDVKQAVHESCTD